jgi:hypothetical protein
MKTFLVLAFLAAVGVLVRYRRIKNTVKKQLSAFKINPSICRAVRFTRARVKDPLNYTLGNQLIPEASSCKYLEIILRSDLI